MKSPLLFPYLAVMRSPSLFSAIFAIFVIFSLGCGSSGNDTDDEPTFQRVQEADTLLNEVGCGFSTKTQENGSSSLALECEAPKSESDKAAQETALEEYQTNLNQLKNTQDLHPSDRARLEQKSALTTLALTQITLDQTEETVSEIINSTDEILLETQASLALNFERDLQATYGCSLKQSHWSCPELQDLSSKKARSAIIESYLKSMTYILENDSDISDADSNSWTQKVSSIESYLTKPIAVSED